MWSTSDSSDVGSCTPILRIIRSAQKPGKIASATTYERRHRQDSDAVFLCTRAGGSGAAVPQALWAVAARPRGDPATCPSCQGYGSEHHGTILHGKQVAVALLVRVRACLAEGLGLRATARGFEVNPNTVLSWLGEAAEHLRGIQSAACSGLVFRRRSRRGGAVLRCCETCYSNGWGWGLSLQSFSSAEPPKSTYLMSSWETPGSAGGFPKFDSLLS